MLKWTKTPGRNGSWTAEGKSGRRYEIEMRSGYRVVPTVGDMRPVKCDTLEAAQGIAWGYEVAFRQAERLAKAGAR